MSIHKSPRSRSLLLVLLLAALSLIAIDQTWSNGPTHALRSVMRDAFNPVTDLAGKAWPFDGDDSSAEELRKENEELKAKLAEAEGQLSKGADSERERKSLTELFQLSTPDNVGKVVARVVATGPTNFDNSIEIDKGSDDGIADGMPVVTGKGLVGRVVQTSGKQSVVKVLSDTTSNVGVRIASTGDVGVAVGQGEGEKLRVDLIDLQSQVKSDDVAVTSGMQGSLFPPGIPVGTITDVSTGVRDLHKGLKLQPFVDAGKLDIVAVLQWRPRA